MKKLQTQLVTFCDYALMSQDNKMSLIGIFDEVQIVQFPGGISRAFWATKFVGEPNTTYQITFTAEHNDKQLFTPIKVDIKTGSSGMHNMFLDMVNMGFPEPGKYEFYVMHGKDKIGVTSLQVLQYKKPDQQERLVN